MQQVPLVIWGVKSRENGVAADRVHVPVTELNPTPIENPALADTEAIIAEANDVDE
jgi:hypothetical protein